MGAHEIKDTMSSKKSPLRSILGKAQTLSFLIIVSISSSREANCLEQEVKYECLRCLEIEVAIKIQHIQVIKISLPTTLPFPLEYCTTKKWNIVMRLIVYPDPVPHSGSLCDCFSLGFSSKLCMFVYLLESYRDSERLPHLFPDILGSHVTAHAGGNREFI